MIDRDETPPREMPPGVSCLACRYSLRGLACEGGIVACPECGMCFHVARLLNASRVRSWRGLPEFAAILMPTVYALVGLVGFGVSVMMLRGLEGWHRHAAVVQWSLFALIAAGWVWLLVRAFQCHRSMWAVLAVLAMHLVWAGYVAGIMTVVIGGGMGAANIVRGEWAAVLQLLFALIFGLGVTTLAYQIEAWIGRGCLARYRLRVARVRPAATS